MLDKQCRCTTVKQMEEDDILVTVGMLVWNNLEATKKCINSIFKNKSKNGAFKLTIVDNDSDEETKKYLSTLTPYCKVITNKENLGFTKGSNQLMRDCDTDYLILINNDCIVLDDWINTLIQPLMMDNNIVMTGTSGRQSQYGTDLHSDCVLFECVAFDTKIFRDIGYLDEQFSPGYYEDDDYNLRVFRYGYDVKIVPHKVLHLHPGSSFGQEKRMQLMKDNYAKFIDKWSKNAEENPITSWYLRHVLWNPYKWGVGIEN